MQKSFVLNKLETLAIILFITFVLALNYKAAEKAHNKTMQKTPQAFLTLEKSVV